MAFQRMMVNWAAILCGVWVAASGTVQAADPKAVTFTTQEDHANMMAQLGITRLRPGRDKQ